MSFIEILKVIFLGIVEGITEWLPISSTGHMILIDEFISLNVTPEFRSMFLVVIQLGAILAVVILFWKKIFPFSFDGGPIIKKNIFVMWIKIVVSCVPAVLVALLWGDEIDELFMNYQTVSIALIVFGIFFIIVENLNKHRRPKVRSIKDISFMAAFIIGLFQVLAAVFPGTSRSGATILGAMIIGISRSVAAEYTFFLSIPVMFGASFKAILDYGFNFTANDIILLLIGMLVAFIVSVFAIKFLLKYIKRHDFKAFGWYRIVLGCVVLGYFIIQNVLL